MPAFITEICRIKKNMRFYRMWSLEANCGLILKLFFYVSYRKKFSHLLKLAKSTRQSLRSVRTWLT